MRTLVLVGSGEFTDSMMEVDRYLLSLVKDRTVAILPTAAGQETNPHQWIKDGVKHFLKLNAHPEGVQVLNRRDGYKKEFIDKVRKSSFVYFSGGYPGYLFDSLVGTPLWNLILNKYKKGDILAGCSAGAMIMGSNILSNGQDVFMQGEWPPVWQKAFNLVPYSIFPHYNWAVKEKSDIFQKIMQNIPSAVKRSWMGIDEETAVIVTDKTNAKVMGKGRVYVNIDGNEKVYKGGNKFVLD